MTSTIYCYFILFYFFIVGDIGISPGTSITGSYVQKPGVTHNNHGPAMDCAVNMKTILAQATAQVCTMIPAQLGKWCFFIIFKNNIYK